MRLANNLIPVFARPCAFMNRSWSGRGDLSAALVGSADTAEPHAARRNYCHRWKWTTKYTHSWLTRHLLCPNSLSMTKASRRMTLRNKICTSLIVRALAPAQQLFRIGTALRHQRLSIYDFS